MTKSRLALLASVVSLLISGSAFAFDFGVGVEGAGTLSLSKNLSGSAQMSTSAAGGIILEERFNLIAVELDLWEDVQSPYTFNSATEGGVTETASYVPIDAGLRLGLGFSPFRPYVGILVNDNILTSGTASATGNWFGLGGDLGIDIAVIFLRFGLDLRALYSLTNVNPGLDSGYTAAGGALILQAILSARFSF